MTTTSTDMALVQPKDPAKHDGLAVASLILAFFFWPLAIILGHCSNHNAKVAWRKRSKLAIGGLAISYLGLALTTVIATVAIAAGSSSQNANAGTNPPAPAAAASTAPASSAPAAAPAPQPNGTYTGSGDYTLSPSLYGNDYLVGEVDLTNTGNVGMVDRVKFTWPQEGLPPIVAHKTVRVPYGHTKVVRFHVSAGNVSNSNVIDSLQSWQDGHNFKDGYTWKVTTIDTFGAAH